MARHHEPRNPAENAPATPPEDLGELLRSLEWAGQDDAEEGGYVACCPGCEAHKGEEHRDYCVLAEWMRRFEGGGTVLINPPRLKIDEPIETKGGILPRGRLERRIVWNLLLHLEARGFVPNKVDSDEGVRTPTALAVMEEAFNLDDCKVHFRRKGGGPGSAWVYLVFGNDGIDCISDAGWTRGKTDDFEKAIEDFDPEAFA